MLLLSASLDKTEFNQKPISLVFSHPAAISIKAAYAIQYNNLCPLSSEMHSHALPRRICAINRH